LLPPLARQQLALDALAGQPVSGLARQHQVSRKFVTQQVQRAHGALEQAFAPPTEKPPQLLFWLPVTTPWLRQLVLALTLVCHSSLRGVTELLRDLFDYSLSPGSAHNILRQAVAAARRHTAGQDLADVRVGAHDEIFQAGRPVLVGADVDSTYCYLLSPEAHRDADTWGVRLLELAERGLAPDATIADAGPGLRAGQAAALPEVPCRGDVFHAVQAVTQLVRCLDNRAYQAIARRSRLDERQAQAQQRHGRKDACVAANLRHARVDEAQAVTLADQVAVLLGWLRHEVLAVAGPAYAERRLLYDWIVDELRAREPQAPHRIGPVRRYLEGQRDDLLAFARQLDEDLHAAAERCGAPPELAAAARRLLSLPAASPQRGLQEQRLWQRWGRRYGALRQALAQVLARVVRASSVAENLNSRLRGYFFLRRQLGPEYLALLQFFLNHRRFLRSRRPERVGQSPAEVLTGRPHRHWLALLGYTPFTRN
jgi:hypothetical protein